MSIRSTTTVDLTSVAPSTPRPSYSPSMEMEYARTNTVGKEYPESELPADPHNQGDEPAPTVASRFQRTIASISHCVQSTGWALCCCGCLPCECLCSACTGRRQSWS
ncbi:hypothetical protein DRE_01170 [Drechslerella stenobrocha 248]|uniref:Uncharacterized protein n=1 Tax=Drechslerella stenobrocha 248 TaxID=1043628 RepID=W7HMJ6_9PEZI|nr:hypothetical protein DRE_01170 [Drechslerella stenobrocha 248]